MAGTNSAELLLRKCDQLFLLSESRLLSALKPLASVVRLDGKYIFCLRYLFKSFIFT